MSCCPPNASPFLAASTPNAGTVVHLPAANVNVYEVGDASSSKGLFVCPDIWGWHGGRTRNVADFFAAQGYLCVVPQLLVPALEGGTDGDGFPPGFDMSVRGGEFKPFMGTFSWDDFKPKMAAVKAHLESKGVSSGSLLGFCFGGWVVCRTLTDPELGGGSFWKAGAIAHPSIQLEEYVYGGKTAELMAQVPAQTPLLLLPAKGDSPNYDAPDGEWISRNCESIRFPDQDHGFVVRGDISNEETNKAVHDALDRIYQFLAKH